MSLFVWLCEWWAVLIRLSHVGELHGVWLLWQPLILKTNQFNHDTPFFWQRFANELFSISACILIRKLVMIFIFLWWASHVLCLIHYTLDSLYTFFIFSWLLGNLNIRLVVIFKISKNGTYHMPGDILSKFLFFSHIHLFCVCVYDSVHMYHGKNVEVWGHLELVLPFFYVGSRGVI